MVVLAGRVGVDVEVVVVLVVVELGDGADVEVAGEDAWEVGAVAGADGDVDTATQRPHVRLG